MKIVWVSDREVTIRFHKDANVFYPAETGMQLPAFTQTTNGVLIRYEPVESFNGDSSDKAIKSVSFPIPL